MAGRSSEHPSVAGIRVVLRDGILDGDLKMEIHCHKKEYSS